MIGVHVRTLHAAARSGRLVVTYDTRTTFRRLRPRATLKHALDFRRNYYGTQRRPPATPVPLTWASVPEDYDVQLKAAQTSRHQSVWTRAPWSEPPVRPSSINGKRGNARHLQSSGLESMSSLNPGSALTPSHEKRWKTGVRPLACVDDARTSNFAWEDCGLVSRDRVKRTRA